MNIDFPYEMEDLPEWLELSSFNFVMAIIHGLQEEKLVIQEFTKFIHQDARLSSIPQRDLEFNRKFEDWANELDDDVLRAFHEQASEGTIGDITTTILRRTERIEKILNLMKAYFRAKREEDGEA